MKTVILCLLLSLPLLAQRPWVESLADSIVTSAAVDTDTVTFSVLNHSSREGAYTLGVLLTKQSGTFPAGGLVLQAQHQVGAGADWYASNGNTWDAVATITTAQADGGEDVTIDLSGLSWWRYLTRLRIRLIAPSGTVNLDYVLTLSGR